MLKDKQKPCRLFVVQGKRPVLMGMSDFKTLELLSVSCKTIQPSWKNKQINEQTTHHKSCINKNLSNNVTTDGKCNNKVSYFQQVTNQQTQYTRNLLMFLGHWLLQMAFSHDR